MTAFAITVYADSLPVENGIADIEVMADIAVATLTQPILGQPDGPELLSELMLDLSESGADHFILDLQNVTMMDSACLGCLVEAVNKMAAKGGKIALVNPHMNVSDLFRLTRLDRVFPICKDVLAAMNAVRRGDEE